MMQWLGLAFLLIVMVLLIRAMWQMFLVVALMAVAATAAIEVSRMAQVDAFLPILASIGAVLILTIWVAFSRRPKVAPSAAATVLAPLPTDDARRWREFRRIAGKPARGLSGYRQTFKRFLLLADRAEFSPETEELAILIRKRVPGLLDSCLEDCATATPAERKARVQETMTLLTELAARAEQRRAALWQSESEFPIYRARLETAPDPLSPA